MPHDRYYVPTPFTPNQTLAIEGEEKRHLKVMRVKAGERVELVNGKGQLAHAKVEGVERTSVEVTVEEVQEEKERLPRLILAQGLPRLNRLDFILEKGCELGASAFWLFSAEQSEKKTLSTAQKERAERILVAAMKQCGRFTLPSIKLCPPLTEWEVFPKYSLFGDLRKDAPMLKDALPKGEEVAFFVGPEAGFTDKEVLILDKAGAQGVKLHDLTLRTDTAPLVALSLLAHLI